MGRKKHEDRPRDERGGSAEYEREVRRGVIGAYNHGPKGTIEGFLLDEGGRTLQVNVPAEFGSAIAAAGMVGQAGAVEVEVEPERGGETHPGARHPVSRLVALRSEEGSVLAEVGPELEKEVRVEGVVDRLNYARHGE